MLEAPLYQQANTYPARLDRQFIEDVFDVEGVIKPAGGALLVSPRAAGANMSVDIAAGRAVIKGDDEANQGSYRVISTAVENRALGAAPGSNSRIDLVVAQVRDANVTGGASSDWDIIVIPGEVAASPVAPAVPPTAIPLAQVLVAAGTLSIDAAKITDRRTSASNAAYAPIFSGVRAFLAADTQVPTGVVTAVPMASEAHDTSGYHDNATNNSRLTIPAGVSRVDLLGQVGFFNHPTGSRGVTIRKNGIDVSKVVADAMDGSDFQYVQAAAKDIPVVAGDFFELFCSQNSGGALNIQGGGALTFFTLSRVAV